MKRKLTIQLAAGLIGVGLAEQAQSANLYWDTDAAASTATGGTGIWDTTSSLWRLNSSTGALQAFAPNNGTHTPRLEGTAGTITIAANTTINVNGVGSNTSSGTYTIAPTDSTSILNLTTTAAITTGTTNSRVLSITAQITGSNGLTLAGTGVLALGASNAYAGGTTIGGAGFLQLDHAGALNSTGTISFTGGTLRHTAINTADYSSRFSTAVNQQYKVDTNNQSITWATALSSSGGSLVKTGIGTLFLTGGANLLGNVTVNGVTGGSSTLNFANGNQLGSGGTLAIGAGVFNGTLTHVGTTASEVDKSLSLPGGTGGAIFEQSGSGAIKFSGASMTAAAGNKTIVLQGNGNGLAEISTVLTNSAGTTNIQKLGSSTWVLSGSNDYTGTTKIDAGTLVAGNKRAFGIPSAAITFANEATLGLATDNGIDPYNLSWANANNPNITVGRATAGNGSATAYALGTLTFGNGTTLDILPGSNINPNSGVPSISFVSASVVNSGGTAQSINATGANVLIGDVINTQAATKAFTFDGTTTGNQITGSIRNDSGTINISKSGAGKWTLTGSNSYIGSTTINAGTLAVTAAGSINSTTSISVGAGTFEYSSSVALSRPVSFSGTDGKFVLDGTTSYTNTTTVSSGNTLSGDGTVGGKVTVSSGGTIAPGHSPGQLKVGDNLVLAGTYSWEFDNAGAIGAAGVNYDQIQVTNSAATLSVGGDLNVSLTSGDYSSGFWNTDRSWKIIDVAKTDGTTGLFDSITSAAPSNEGTFDVTFDNGDAILNWNASGGNTISLTASATGTNYGDNTDTSENPGSLTAGSVHVAGTSASYLSEVDGLTSNQNSGSAEIDNTLGGETPVYVMIWTEEDALLTETLVATNGTVIASGTDQWNALQSTYGLSGIAGNNFEYLVRFTTNPFGPGAAVNWDFGSDSGVKVDRIAVVPEPASIALLGLGAASLLTRRKRRSV